MNDVDILALGEPMVEFNQTGAGDGRLYLQGFGGDTSNFAIAAARQGARVGCIGALGDDDNGRMLRELWAAEGVDATSVSTDPAGYTAIYFVSHGQGGHRFTFFRSGSAASRMTPDRLPRARIEAAKVLHLSGISLAISANARATCEAAMAIARNAGVQVSFDTNLRLKLWPLAQARSAIEAAIAKADICLPSYDDMAAIWAFDEGAETAPTTVDGTMSSRTTRSTLAVGTPTESTTTESTATAGRADEVIDRCLALGARTVALKCGAAGAIVADARQRHRIAPFPCRPVDATGAGDAFGGAFVARLVAGDNLLDAGRYAAAAAALSTEGFGAVEPIPTAARVRAAMLKGST